ncbi:sensor histidine kinase [Pelagibius sp. Alg239-R121]|uniref:sensor histidine kinase n=1 Tax=Pelagibius sp. Alg239-R121 TaxID=2993448 RepID=UPI0024A6EF9E|nr:sensor histidine kinase [Pelagibius sp. Alg239-R121]
MPRSLTARVIVASLVWIVVALGAGGWVIKEVFHTSIVRQFDVRLEAQLELLTASIAKSGEDPADRMSNPDFERVYSGAYWQAESGEGRLYRSRSLWDASLPVTLTDADRGTDRAEGPDGKKIRLLTRMLSTPDQQLWVLAVGENEDALQEEFAQFQRTLLIAAAVLGVALLAAAFLLLRTALLPLKELRRAVVDRHSGHQGEITGVFSVEVAPLVEDLNSLLERNERLREKGRVQAANLAHALKTPAAVLHNEIQKVRRGEALNTVLAEEAIENVSAAADRHLSLAAAAPEDMAFPVKTDIVPVAGEVVRAIGRLFPDVAFDIQADDGLILDMSKSDQFELLGNLVENAAKWAKSRVVLRLSTVGDCGVIVVEDDGAGVPEASRSRILEQGVRLDESRKGSGLGLTIVSDILERHRSRLDLGTSELGGLLVEIEIPNEL